MSTLGLGLRPGSTSVCPELDAGTKRVIKVIWFFFEVSTAIGIVFLLFVCVYVRVIPNRSKMHILGFRPHAQRAALLSEWDWIPKGCHHH